MIKALSPYYITIPFTSPLTALVSDYFILNIYVWAGIKTDVPPASTYEVTIQNVESSAGNKEINISNWIADFIDFSPATFTGTQLVNGNNQYWVKWETKYKTTNEADFTTPTNQNTVLYLRGYGYAMEGKNTTTPANKILIPIVDYKVNRSGKFVFPIVIDETPSLEGAITIDLVTYNSSSSTSSDISIDYTITGFAPATVNVETSADGITFTSIGSFANTGNIPNVVITYPLGGSTFVRLSFIDTNYYTSNVENIGLE